MDAILFVWGDEGASSWGVFNCRNTNTPGGSSQKSVHAQGRAGDTKIIPNGSVVGRLIAEALAQFAVQLHVQFVIWARKKWGCSYSSAGQDWEDWLAYGGYAHLDHVHWELNWEGAKMSRVEMRALAIKLFTGQEVDDMTPAQEAKLDKAIALSTQVLDSLGVRYPDGPTVQKAVVKYGDDDGTPGTPNVPMEHFNVLQDFITAKFGEVEKRLIRIEAKP